MNEKKRGLAWSGVSSKKQAENISPQEQLDLCHQHAAKWGVEIIAELEVAESRSITLFEDAARRIPAYADLHRMIRNREIDVLFCYDVGRLGRKRALTLTIIDLCVEAGILVYEIESPPHSLDESYDYGDLIIHAIEATGYQYEVEKLKERLAYGRIGRVKAGNMPSGRPPYGYRVTVRLERSQTVRAVEIDAAAAAVVREIFRRYLDGAGLGTIAAALNARGILSPRGVAWNYRLVVDLIGRAWRYAGYGETTVTHKAGRSYVKAPGRWPPIIDAATAERALAERTERAANRRISDTTSRLTGVVWCVRCQRPMNQSLPAVERSGRPRHVRFYCKNPLHANAVPTSRIHAALRLALDELAGADLSAIADAPPAALESIRQRMAEHEAAIKRHQARLEHAVSLAVENLLPADTLRSQLERIQAAIAAEQAALDRLAAQQDAEQSRGTQRERLAQIVASGYAMLTTPNTALANTWWRQFVRVWCDDNQIVEVRLG